MNPRTHHQHEAIIIAVRREVDSGYRVTCAELPPVLAFGETLDEARANAREEIEAWVETTEASADYSIRFR